METELRSYWDMLPPEIKEYILEWKESQELIDRRESDLNRALCKEIDVYRQLRIKWFIGPIECRCYYFKGCQCESRCMYTMIYGHYWNLLGIKSKVFLDFNFEDAIAYSELARHETRYQTSAEYSMSVLSLYCY